ncbi:HNH endonuclease [Halalkalibacterium halodurans]|uniref:HNH endonuclease n=1 Tax=Halalkalibacterium halodurans TaxID=86665 RepID=UPI001F3DABEE|nr:HNH endonuclease [Halalkalibacterium halodurans]MDY7222075.1 HNH endonuclease [Halalkalibacterium halodurans]MDY7243906.1 HNH endonuclease [Halalkalibacterium halodurans]
MSIPELELDPDNCESICPSCHNKEHPEKGSNKPIKRIRARVVEEKGNPDHIF